MKQQLRTPADGKIIPAALAGFEGINRYWDRRHGVVAAKILPGEYYVSVQDEVITTVLGSCISACVRDVKFGIGGMNHFMLPEMHDQSDNWSELGVGFATRYGNVAMEHLVNAILKQGGMRKNLEVKVFGGGDVMGGISKGTVGAKNIRFVTAYIEQERLKLVGEDMGDLFPRKVMYYPQTGKAFVKKLTNIHNDTILRREEAYQHRLEDKPMETEVEIFK